MASPSTSASTTATMTLTRNTTSTLGDRVQAIGRFDEAGSLLTTGTGAMHQVRTSWIKRRKENGKKEASAFGFHVLGPLGGGSDKNVSADSSSGLDQDQQMQLHQGGAAAKGLRAIVLAAWIVETFGKDFLNSGSGVVDVAGGQGALTYELQAVHGVRCTLVEPRPFKLNRFQVKQMKKRADEAAAARAGDMAQHQVEPGSLDTALVEEEFQLLLFGNDSGYDEVEQGEQPENSAANGGSKGASSRVSRPEDAFSQVMDHFEPKLWEEGGPHFELLRSCSMVVGLHPDQATEPILKFALEFKKSFVIAPCCVFPRLFPHRRIKPGTESTLRQPASGQQGIVPSTSSTGSTDNHSFLDGEGLAFDAGGRPLHQKRPIQEHALGKPWEYLAVASRGPKAPAKPNALRIPDPLTSEEVKIEIKIEPGERAVDKAVEDKPSGNRATASDKFHLVKDDYGSWSSPHAGAARGVQCKGLSDATAGGRQAPLSTQRRLITRRAQREDPRRGACGAEGGANGEQRSGGRYRPAYTGAASSAPLRGRGASRGKTGEGGRRRMGTGEGGRRSGGKGGQGQHHLSEVLVWGRATAPREWSRARLEAVLSGGREKTRDPRAAPLPGDMTRPTTRPAATSTRPLPAPPRGINLLLRSLRRAPPAPLSVGSAGGGGERTHPGTVRVPSSTVPYHDRPMIRIMMAPCTIPALFTTNIAPYQHCSLPALLPIMIDL
eukprot:gene16064-22202_t